MESSFGSTIRKIREQKRIGLNEFAKELGVSAGYLSNLETGKTDTVRLGVLHKLQHDLNIYPVSENGHNSEIEIRIERLSYLIRDCYQIDSTFTNYFLSTIEEGLDLVLKNNRNEQ